MHQHQLVTDKQAAALLSISRATWWRKYAKTGLVPVVRLGPRCTRFRLLDIEALLEGTTA